MLAMRTRHTLKPNGAERLRLQIRNAVELALDARAYYINTEPDVERTDAGASIGYAETELGTVSFCIVAANATMLVISSEEADMERARRIIAETCAAPLPETSLFKSLRWDTVGSEIFHDRRRVYLPPPSEAWIEKIKDALADAARLERVDSIAASVDKHIPSDVSRIAWELFVTTFGDDGYQWIAVTSRGRGIALRHNGADVLTMLLDAHGIERVGKCEDTSALLNECASADKRIGVAKRLRESGHAKIASWLTTP